MKIWKTDQFCVEYGPIFVSHLNFAHARIALLSWHVQNFNVIKSIEFSKGMNLNFARLLEIFLKSLLKWTPDCEVGKTICQGDSLCPRVKYKGSLLAVFHQLLNFIMSPWYWVQDKWHTFCWWYFQNHFLKKMAELNQHWFNQCHMTMWHWFN